MDRELALVTGASAGIGTHLARLFAADGSDLVLVARRGERLEALAQDLRAGHGVQVHVIPFDLGRPRAAEALVAELAARGLEVDVLVNNAGFGARGRFTGQEPELLRAMIDLNVTELVALTRALLPAMVARGRGGVVNIASTAAFQAGPYMSVYYATKAFVLSFTEGLAVELDSSGVTACCVCPGATRTEFADVAGMTDLKLFDLTAMDARKVARIGYRGFRRGRTVVVTGLSNWLGSIGAQIAPRVLSRWLVGRMQAPE
ncbi:SDR family NAD(P)-dependent oxidoreductase [Engelhardtia mirabilis]|uniref:NADP-dependent 3-hydroxy acid dehydrogenase YdfG n=1 Tax=Engelhardtia mirabilis TaxID=2528011 RepID=A0A518BFG5_9BACT|nr:NADP-dependent 3-hydroxy acid dehydrogenase YdfG [Planctomycetes bacterium Pla133]QDV00050.1 NADP-dependent 3-hydroxy acid dehydrogenase YdfG [Planctomycetes bacterium Pla86]